MGESKDILIRQESYVEDLVDEEDLPNPIPCSMCGRMTYRDPIYGDLCSRCCRVDNE